MLAQIWRVSFTQHLFIFIRDELILKSTRVNIDSLWCVISLSQSVKNTNDLPFREIIPSRTSTRDYHA